MIQLACTLVTDGSSDRALLPLLAWLFNQHNVAPAPEIQWYDQGKSGRRVKSLSDRIGDALVNYPCELLFIHRDAETSLPGEREREIQQAIDSCARNHGIPPVVFVIPVRMTEAWLLFDEASIRGAAGRPTGKTPLKLTKFSHCERIADPKALLRHYFCIASELKGRHLKRFHAEAAVHRLAELIEDYSPLRDLPAFARMEAQLVAVLKAHGLASRS